MVKSMTGFAAVTHEDDRASIALTMRALNHRYLDLQLRLPHALAPMENELRAMVTARVARGRVEISVALQLRQTPGVDVELNTEFGRALAAALDEARARGLVSGALTPGDLLRLPQALTIRERQSDFDGSLSEALAAPSRAAVERALTELDQMRLREGEHLRVDLDRRRASVAELIERIASAADLARDATERRLAERIRELRVDLKADETAIAQEIVRLAARSDISEEVARFRGHISHWVALSDGPEPCGRKLDFLLQEMHREVNTIGSKADGLAVSELVIAAKAELEKMREQVQNVE